MAVKSFKPTTPARRQMTVPGFDEITKKTPEKSLITVLKKHAGRNNTGKITVRHHGGGNRIKYRVMDFRKKIEDVPATVLDSVAAAMVTDGDLTCIITSGMFL